MSIQSAVRPAHHIYLRIDPSARGESATLTSVHVQGPRGTSGNYLAVPLTGRTPQDLAASALLTVLGAIPYYATVYIHSSNRDLRDLLRQRPAGLPKEIREGLQRKNIALRPGSLEQLDVFWGDLLDAVSRQALPKIGALNQYQLYTYAVCDGLRTYASGLLYGDGQIHICSQKDKGIELAAGELTMAAWAFSLLPAGKCVELHQHNPELREYWEGDAAQFVHLYPGAEDSSKQVGRHLKAKALRFNVAPAHSENVLWRGTRWLAGRMLA